MTAIPPLGRTPTRSLKSKIQMPSSVRHLNAQPHSSPPSTPGPSELQPGPCAVISSAWPPPPAWSLLGHSEAGGVRGQTQAQSYWNCCPILRHTHTHPRENHCSPGKPECSTERWLPPVCPDAYSSLGPRPRPLPRSRGCPSSFPCTQSQPSVLRPAAAEHDKSAPPRARLAGTGQSTAGVGKGAPRWCLPQEVPADGRPPGAPGPRGPAPARQPAFVLAGSAGSVPLGTHDVHAAGPAGIGGQPAPSSPVRTDTAPGRAPGGRLGPRASLPAGPEPTAARRPPSPPRPRPGTQAGRPARPALAPRPARPRPPQSGSLRPDSSLAPAPSPELVRVSPPRLPPLARPGAGEACRPARPPPFLPGRPERGGARARGGRPRAARVRKPQR